MAILYKPDTLSNITVREIANYITYFTKWTIMINKEHYQKPCDLLEKIINLHVPPSMAKNVTAALMRQVNHCHNSLKNHRVFKTHCERFAPYVLKSVIHKSVTSLDCIPDTAHPTLFDYYKVRDCDLIYKTLSFLHGLKELRLGTAHRTDNMTLDIQGFGDTLEEFASRSCLDRDVETLATHCKRLRCLDISCSEGISDGVVDYILKFENLEELNLCEVSFLSEDVLQRILKGLTEGEVAEGEDLPKASTSTGISRSQRLKVFGCNNPSEHQITLIAQFHNLTTLAFSNVVETQLTPLRHLKRLENLTLKKSKFICATELLTSVGNQLKCLNIVDVSGTDYNFISVNCQSLSCLHLCFEDLEELSLPSEYRQAHEVTLSVPEFPTVESLQLFLRDYHAADYIVTGFKNVRNLNTEKRFSDMSLFIEGIMRRKNLIHLKNVFWENAVAKCSQKECCMFKFFPEGTSVQNMVEE